MFAARFDPNSLIVESETIKSTPQKRKLSEVEISDVESDSTESSESDSDSDSATDSGSDDQNSSRSDSSSDSDSDSDLDSSVEADDTENESVTQRINTADNNTKHDTDEEMHDQFDTTVQPQEHDSKFSTIISKFNKSITKSSKANELQAESDEDDDQNEQHDLAPLPQPKLPRDIRLSRQQKSNSLDWLSDPLYISPTVQVPFTQFKIDQRLLSNLQSLGFDKAFASQVRTLELLLPEINNKLNPNAIKGDVLVNASTGSGKTLAYSIPIIQSLLERKVPRLRCIILVPTKPLIKQVYNTLTLISKGFDLNITTLGKSTINEEHFKLIKNVPDILVSTPGRLVDHLQLKSINLSSLNWCIIDEADRLLNQSYQDWSNVLIKELNQTTNDVNISEVFKPNLCKMIFSATLTTDSGKLANLKFNKPRLIIVNEESSILTRDQIFTLPLTLRESIWKLPSSKNSTKPLILLKLLSILQYPSNVLIFTKSNESTLRLSRLLTILSQGLKINLTFDNINSQLSASIKSKILNSFDNSEINVLISTDLMARGIDISSIKYVINYDLPNSSREYVHRVGRTARAGLNGEAYSLIFGKGELRFWDKFNLDINRNGLPINEVEVEPKVEDFEEKIYQESLKELEKEVFKK